MTTLVRRRGLGHISCRGVADKMDEHVIVARSDHNVLADSTYIRWGCTSTIPRGHTTINKAEAIHEVSQKATFRKLMADAGLAPATWLSIDDCPTSEIERGVVVRPSSHAGGRRFHLCHTWDAVNLWAQHYGESQYYISTYIPKVKEFRVVVAQGRVVFVVEKVVEDVSAHAWNRQQGARFVEMKWSDWPLKAVKVAVEAFNLSSLDFGGVDVMVDDEGVAYVLEINSAPTLTSPYRQQKMANAFDWMLSYGQSTLPVVEELGGWKKWGHPSLSERVLVPEGVIV